MINELGFQHFAYMAVGPNEGEGPQRTMALKYVFVDYFVFLACIL